MQRTRLPCQLLDTRYSQVDGTARLNAGYDVASRAGVPALDQHAKITARVLRHADCLELLVVGAGATGAEAGGHRGERQRGLGQHGVQARPRAAWRVRGRLPHSLHHSMPLTRAAGG